VRDRIVYHAVFSALNRIFEPTFIAHSFSCRKGKGTHKGVDALGKMLRQVSQNHMGSCFALKCDVHQFFASVDHGILLNILGRRIKDERVMALLTNIIRSFSLGIPIGNLTSQLFANVYMNEFDQFMKHTLRIKHYVRYTDDFVIVAQDEASLRALFSPIASFLHQYLQLSLHPYKMSIRKYRQGIDFLGYVLLPHHRMLRTKTKRRIFRKLSENATPQSLQSYLGVLSHANAHRLSQKLANAYLFVKA
jgi:retron-type reverse transcriptase